MASPNPTLNSDLHQHLASGELAGTWSLDAARSSARFRTKAMWGMVPVKGDFSDLEGTLNVTADGQTSANVTVSVASISTKNKKRDAHLRSGDFFDAEAHPNLLFTLDRLDASGDQAEASGTLEIAGSRQPLNVPIAVSKLDDDALGFDASFSLDRSDYGMNWTQMGASLQNTITVHAVFTRG